MVNPGAENAKELGRVKLIVGLGNPGPEYRNTRHNVGFCVADLLAERFKTGFDREKYNGLLADAVIEGERALFLKPMTFMNLSGECAARAMRYQGLTPEDLLVVVDDVNLPLGKLRLRTSGSAGGHNGLISIIQHLGTDAFARLRLGVGRSDAGKQLRDHVLGRFTPSEKEPVDDMVKQAADAVECFIRNGITPAMNRFNA